MAIIVYDNNFQSCNQLKLKRIAHQSELTDISRMQEQRNSSRTLIRNNIQKTYTDPVFVPYTPNVKLDMYNKISIYN